MISFVQSPNASFKHCYHPNKEEPSVKGEPVHSNHTTTRPLSLLDQENQINVSTKTTEQELPPHTPSIVHLQPTLLALITLLPIISASALHPNPGVDIVFNQSLFLDTIGAVPTVRNASPFKTLPPDY
jgi:hypothetical protein